VPSSRSTDRGTRLDLLDAASTIREVVGRARRDRGRVAAAWAALTEWWSLLLSILLVRLGLAARITSGARPRRPPRRPLMLTDTLRHAWRRVTARPGSALLAAAMLGAGIALATAMFTVVDALLLRPVPFRDPERLARIQVRGERSGRLVVPPALLRAWKDAGLFDAVEGVSALNATTGMAVVDTGTDLTMRAGARVTSGVFAMLGVAPIRGRVFLPDEGRSGSDARVILSETLWRGLFGGAGDIVGRSIQIDGRPHLVVGIMPKEFRFPQWNTEVWRPIDYAAPPPALEGELPGAYVRRPAGTPEADVARRATDVMHAVDPSLGDRRVQLDPLVYSSPDEYYKRAVPMLAAGVGLVFLVLCANVSGLLLAQLTLRRREYGVCAALGASRGRLVREALAESAAIGAMGVGIGLGGAWVLVGLARAFLPEALLVRSLNPVDLDARALAAASLLGFAATLLAGLLPAWIGTAVDRPAVLRAAERGHTDTRAARLASRGLLVVEIALACSLLSGATLLVRSFINLAGADRGLRTEDVLTAWIQMPATARDAASRQAVSVSIEEAIRGTPGVEVVALSLGLPPRGGSLHFFSDWRSDAPGAAPVNLVVQEYYVRPDFFHLYGIPLVRGRTFQAGDPETTVVIGERLARALWPDGDPVGRSFSFGKRQGLVVGLAKEISLPTLEARLDMPEFYSPFASGGGQVMLSIRCAASCPPLPAIKGRIEAVHAGLRINDLGRLDDRYAEHVARPRAAAALGTVFAGIAVAASAGGLLSVLTYAVSRRRREFGIRVAIGASPRQIRRLVVRDGLGVAAVGIGFGAAAGWALGRAMAAFQYGVTANDAVTWAVVLVVVAGTSLAASWRPARHAMRVDPVSLLREE